MRGAFSILLDGVALTIPNTVLAEGEDTFLKMALCGDDSVVAAYANFYMGLCGAAFTQTTTLATLAGEPTATNGYARQAIQRSSAGWPLISVANGITFARSAVCNFVASGGDYSTEVSRLFLCTAASGTSGKLLAVSAALPTPKLLTNGYSLPAQYELYMN